MTSEGSSLLIGYCSKCNGKESLTVSSNTIQAEGLGDFFNNLGKNRTWCIKKMAKNVLKNPSRAFDITANVATAAASRNPKMVLKSLPELIIFHKTGKGLYLDKLV